VSICYAGGPCHEALKPRRSWTSRPSRHGTRPSRAQRPRTGVARRPIAWLALRPIPAAGSGASRPVADRRDRGAGGWAARRSPRAGPSSAARAPAARWGAAHTAQEHGWRFAQPHAGRPLRRRPAPRLPDCGWGRSKR
jgi:hypothetical protein